MLWAGPEGRRVSGWLRPAATILLLACAWWALPCDQVPLSPTRDETAAAEQFLHGLPGDRVSSSMPLESAAEGLLVHHGCGGFWAAAALAVAGLVLTFTLGCLLHSPLCGALAAALAAPSLPFGTDYMSCYVLLVLLAANALVWLARAPDLGRGLVASAAVGLTVLLRSPLFFFGAVLAAILWLTRRGQERPWRGHELAFIGLLPILLLLPWMRMNWAVHHRFVPFEDGRADFNIVMGAANLVYAQEGDWRRQAGPAAGGASVLGLAAAAVLAHPFSYLASCARRLWFFMGLNPFLLLLALLAAWRLRKERGVQLLAVLAACYVGIHCLLAVKASYFDPAWPLLAVLAAGCADWLFSAEPRPAGACAWIAGGAAVPAGLLGLYTLWLAAVYPARAAEPGRLAGLLRSRPGWACLHSEQGRRSLRDGDLDGAVEHLSLAERLGPRPDRELDLAWAVFAQGGPAAQAAGDLPWAEVEGLDGVRWRLFRMLGSLQGRRCGQARAEFSAAARQWAEPYALALSSPRPEDRAAQARLMRGDPLLAQLLAELLGPIPPERQAALLERFESCVAPADPEAGRVAAALDQPQLWAAWAGLAAERGAAGEAFGYLSRLPAGQAAAAERAVCAAAVAVAGRGETVKAREFLSAFRRRPVRPQPRCALELAGLAAELGAREDLRYFSGLARPWLAQPEQRASVDPDLLRGAASLAAAAGDQAEAFRVLLRLKALARDGRSRQAAADVEDGLCAAAERRVRAKQRGQALEVLRGFVRRSIVPEPRALLKLAGLAARLGARAEAEYFLGQARPGAVPEAQLASAALLYQRLGLYPQALGLWEALVREQPGSGSYLNGRGVVKALMGRPQEAMADWRSAIAKDPGLLEPYLSLGALLSAQGRPAEASAWYEQALRSARPGEARSKAALR
ncbi:MAG: tetratricopeptide repeat protein, partial [Elusimicrobia bacterium]|nr:tetratricopeptide repeat protein [Elusimicrobiota bacterium]